MLCYPYCSNIVTEEARTIEEKKLISKKELLARFSISYGALYRYKRKGLIPEEWFIKKAAPTGQETYFPEELVCERMALILAARDESSLEELAARLNGAGVRQSVLVLETAYGKKRFPLSEILSAYREDGDGGRRELTGLIKGPVDPDGKEK